MPLTAEEVGKVRAALAGETSQLTDEQVASGAADTIIQQAKKIRDQAADRQAVQQELADARRQLTEANAKLPRTPDAGTLAMYAEVIEAKRRLVLDADVPEAALAPVDALFRDDKGQPTALALSATAERGRPAGYAAYDAVAQTVKHLRDSGFGPKPGVEPGKVPPVVLSGAGGEPQPVSKDRQNELRALAGLPLLP